MLQQKPLVTFFLLASLTSCSLWATIGTLEESIQSGLENRDPNYFDEFIEAYTKKLREFTKGRAISSEQERQALFGMMKRLVRLKMMLCDSVWRSSMSKGLSGGWSHSWGDPNTNLRVSLWGNNSFDEARSILAKDLVIASTLAKESMRKETKDSLSEKQLSDLRYRVGEWHLLNRILDNLDRIMEILFENSLQAAKNLVETKSPESTKPREFLSYLQPNTRVILEASIAVIDKLIFVPERVDSESQKVAIFDNVALKIIAFLLSIQADKIIFKKDLSQ